MLQGKGDTQDEMKYVCAIEDLFGINVFDYSLNVLMLSDAPTPRVISFQLQLS